MSGLALAGVLAAGMTGELALLWAAGALLSRPEQPPEGLRAWLGLEGGAAVSAERAQLHARLGLALAGLSVAVGLALGVGFGLLRVLPRG